MRIIGHLISTLFGAFWRIVAMVIFSAALGVGGVVVLIDHYAGRWQWPPSQLTAVALVGVGVLAAYAGGTTVLMAESIKALMGAVKVVEHEAVAPLKAVGQELEGR